MSQRLGVVGGGAGGPSLDADLILMGVGTRPNHSEERCNFYILRPWRSPQGGLMDRRTGKSPERSENG